MLNGSDDLDFLEGACELLYWVELAIFEGVYSLSAEILEAHDRGAVAFAEFADNSEPFLVLLVLDAGHGGVEGGRIIITKIALIFGTYG